VNAAVASSERYSLDGRAVAVCLVGLTCEHRQLRECHPGCGHFWCSQCGLTWDEAAEGDSEYMARRAERILGLPRQRR
jgi:hypothetical protein